jgi:DNA-binding PucR family transcriptional regulator
MRNTVLSLYVSKAADQESVAAFFQLVQPLSIVKIDACTLRVAIDETLDTAEIAMMVAQITEELLLRPTAFSHVDQAGFDRKAIEAFLPLVPSGFYTLETLIPEVVLRQKETLATMLRTYIQGLVGHDTLDTVLRFIEANLNQSKAAKDMYMHRNTLLYRLDQFGSQTGIEPRTFQGAFALKLLFR